MTAFDQASLSRRALAVAAVLLASAAVMAGGLAGGLRAEDGKSRSSASHEGGKRVKPRARHGEAPVVAADDPAPETRPAAAPRICIIDRAAVDQQATVSVASNNRLAELRAGAQAQVDGQKKTLDTQSRGIEEDIKLHPDDPALKQRRLALAMQMQAVVDQASVFSRSYEATRQGINNQLRNATTPIVQGIAASNGCAMVLSSEVVVDAGDAIDITHLVVEKMNAQLQFKPFALVDLQGR